MCLKAVEAADEDAVFVRQCLRFSSVTQEAVGIATEFVDTSSVSLGICQPFLLVSYLFLSKEEFKEEDPQLKHLQHIHTHTHIPLVHAVSLEHGNHSPAIAGHLQNSFSVAVLCIHSCRGERIVLN